MTPSSTSPTDPSCPVTDAGTAGEDGSLEWTVHLARRRPRQAAATAILVLAVSVWAFFLFHSLVPAAATAFLLTGAVGEFLFPIRFRLSPEGAEARGLVSWRRIAWTEVKRVYAGKEEIKLSPLEHGGRREAFRGVLLRCDENRDAVLAAVERFRDAASRD